jgi:predicted dehydrogenase
MKIALIGLGVMGKNHLRILKGMGGVEIVGLCDPTLHDESEIRTYAEVDDMLKKETIDGAIISVPTPLHMDIALKCIAHQINVLIEKPLAASVSEAREIQQAVSQYRVKTAVGHVERFNPVVKSLIHEISDKTVYSINITRVGPFPPRITDVGVLVDLSVHDVDLIRFITNKKRIVESRIFKSHKCWNCNNSEDNAVISLKLENEIITNITTNWLTPFKKRMIEVATDRAYYEANLLTQELKEYSAYKRDESFVVRTCTVGKGEPLVQELRTFLQYLTTGDPDVLATIDDGIKTLEVIDGHINGYSDV